MLTRVTEFLPADLGEGIRGARIELPPDLFYPGDSWARVFQRGLLRLQLRGRIHEVGVGAGCNALQLVTREADLVVSFSDFHSYAAELAEANICRNLDRSDWSRVLTIQGSVDLLGRDWLVIEGLDTVVACIPQVPANGIELGIRDHMAHHYDETYYQSELHCLGLGLNDALLAQAVKAVRPGGRVVLNLGGRPGLKRLVEMFRHRGYEQVRVVYGEMISQDPTTCLRPLAKLEAQTGEGFEFFADRAGTQPINARQAETRRLAGLPLFHRVYVMSGVWPGGSTN